MSNGPTPERVLDALLTFLAERPELRVGQAIALATHHLTGRFDPFSVEDGELAKALERLTSQARAARREAFSAELVAYLDAPGPLSEWVFGLGRWGPGTLVLAAFAVAEPCLGTWGQGVPDDPDWQHHFADAPEPAHALAALRRALGKPRERVEAELRPELSTLRDRLSAAQDYAAEASGSAELCRRRERCAAAGRAIQLALEAALWTSDQATAGVPDEAERRALVAAGPARETWEAVRAFLAAHPDVPESVARDHIRRVLLAPRQ